MAADGKAPIIIKKKKAGHHGHHGGAWKVAYADFVTAMMAFFMVMWLMGSDEEVKVAIAQYFNNPQDYLTSSKDGPNPSETDVLMGLQGGAPEDIIDKPSKALPAHADEQRILSAIAEIFEGSAFSVEADDLHVKFAIPGYVLFRSGSTQLSDEAIIYMKKLTPIFRDYEGKIYIEGHTNRSADEGPQQNSWALSFDRAMAVRNFFVFVEGLSPQKFIPVAKGDQFPYTQLKENDQKNRRVEFILRHVRDPEKE